MRYITNDDLRNLETSNVNEEDYEKKGPLISVVIPVFNAATSIKKCLGSVISSTLKNIEIICVDDGSTDNSLEILRSCAIKDKRIKVLSQNNMHAGIARNKGIEVARGKYIHFLDADDCVDSVAYEKWYQIAEQNKSEVCVCLYNTIDKQTGEVLKVNKNKKYNDSYLNTTNITKDAQYLISNAVVPWNKIYLKSFLLRFNIRFDDLICANDRSFYYTVIYKAERITTVQEYWINHIINNEKSLVGNTRLENFDVHFKSFAIIWKVIQSADDKVKKMILNACIGDSFYFYRKSIGTKHQKRIEKQMFDFWHEKYLPLLGDSIYTKWWFSDYLKIALREISGEDSSEILAMFDSLRKRHKNLEAKYKNDLNSLRKKNKRLEVKYDNVLNSRSYKIGRVITLPGRIIKSWFKGY